MSDNNWVSNVHTSESFAFDKVFHEEYSTDEIFQEYIHDHIKSSLEGINVTIFAYGQTCSGKTFTMLGDDKNPGLIPQTISEIFKHTQDSEDADGMAATTYKVTCSFFEIYNESVNDLLDPKQKNLEVRESISQSVYIQNLTSKECKDEDEMIGYLKQGQLSRITAATNLNEVSSRSHTVFRFNIEITERNNGQISVKTSQFNLVDLAGSEGVSKTGSEGIRFREGSNINKSLLALSKVIQRLSSFQSKLKVFINYRDSKLTRILQPALGGNSKTIIICTLSQLFWNYQESVKTLLFGQMAKSIKTTVNVNEIIKNKEQLELKAAKEENEFLREKIHELEFKLKEIVKLPMTEIKINNALWSPPQVHINKEFHSAKLVKHCHDDMEIDGKLERSDISCLSNTKSTVSYLKEHIAYLHSQIFEKSQELDHKDAIIKRLQTENSSLIGRLEQLYISSDSEISPKPKEKPDLLQKDNLLNSDGIKWFSLSQDEDEINILSGIENQTPKFETPSSLHNSHDIQKSLNETIQKQEKQLKKLNKELELLLDNSEHMKNEVVCLRQTEIMKTEDLENREKEIEKLKEELNYYKETNKELINSIDEVERTLQELEENNYVPKMRCLSHDSGSPHHTPKDSANKDWELKEQIEGLQYKCSYLSEKLNNSECERKVLEESLRTAQSNIEILNETLEFMGDESIVFQGELLKKKEALIYKNKEKENLESDLEDFKNKVKKQSKCKKHMKDIADLTQKVKEQEEIIANLQSKINQKEQEYNELKENIDKVKKLKDSYESIIAKEKHTLKEQFDKEKKALQKDILDLKSKLYNSKNCDSSLGKIKKLSTSLLDRDIEIKTLKADKERYMSEVVDLKVQQKSDYQKYETQISELQTQLDSFKLQSKSEIESMGLRIVENNDLLQNYKKFVRDMNGVVKLLVKGSTQAIDATKDKNELNTEENLCYKTLLEQKVMLLKVERKIIHKKSNGFKPMHKLHHDKSMTEEEAATTNDELGFGGQHKRVKISE